MKCTELGKIDLAKAYEEARGNVGGGEVTMDALAPKLKEIGSTCGTCPALLVAAKAAFEAKEAGALEPINPVQEDTEEMAEALPTFKLPEVGG